MAAHGIKRPEELRHIVPDAIEFLLSLDERRISLWSEHPILQNVPIPPFIAGMEAGPFYVANDTLKNSGLRVLNIVGRYPNRAARDFGIAYKIAPDPKASPGGLFVVASQEVADFLREGYLVESIGMRQRKNVGEEELYVVRGRKEKERFHGWKPAESIDCFVGREE